MNLCDRPLNAPETNPQLNDNPKKLPEKANHDRRIGDLGAKKIGQASAYVSVSPNEDEDIPDDKQNSFELQSSSAVNPNSKDLDCSNSPAKKWKRTSGKILWKRLSHTDLKHPGGQELDKAKYNWTLVAEKLSVIIKDLKAVRAQGFKGVVIKEDFWTQSIYANVEGSAGFPDITRVWKHETEKLEAEGKPTVPFEEWVQKHHEEISRRIPNAPKIQYLDPSHAKKYMARIEQGKFTFNDLRGIMPIEHKTQTTINYSNGDWMEKENLPGGKGYANFVISKEKEFYLGSHSGGIFHHTSFQKGAVVIGAGATAIGHIPPGLMQDVLYIEQMKLHSSEKAILSRSFQVLLGQPLIGLNPMPTESGVMRILSSTSGHYKPDRENLIDTLKVCKEKGIDLSRVITIEESELGQCYFASGLEFLTNPSTCKPYRCNNMYAVTTQDKSEVLALISKNDSPRINKQELNSLKLFQAQGFCLKSKDLYKITSFGILTFSLLEYIQSYNQSYNQSITIHPTSWNMGLIEHNGEGKLRLIKANHYKNILGLLSFLKHISTAEDYAKINILYANRNFNSPDDFERWF